jgi:hypothetical protein
MLARVSLTFAALLPYWRLLTFRVVYVTDDYFASDIFNGELPGRVIIGRLIRAGQLPVWTNQLCSGLSLTGSPADPIGLAIFTLLPPAAALDLLVIVLLLVAAHGTYGLARRFGADRIEAVLAGVAFAGSGYIACQLKHLSIVSTVVWLPVGIGLLDRVLSGDEDGHTLTPGRRALLMATFGLVVGQQALSGFPQSVYICGLVYGAFTLFRALTNRSRTGSFRPWLMSLGGVGLATALGAAAGAVVLLPLSALGSVSDRSEALGWDWSTRLAYWPKNALTFLVPYIHGDISNNTYVGPPFFWEDYGYVGVLTFLLAIYGAFRERRRPAVTFTIVMTLLAYLFVLGNATPVFLVAYLVLPGMKLFRFPTRFLIVVELGLALLAAFGLMRLRADLERSAKMSARLARGVALAVCFATAMDLFIHQPRQNPMVPANAWLAPPRAVDIVHAGSPEPRTFTPHHRDLHRYTFLRAHGWANVEPYFELRDVLQPNIGGFWQTPSADCYVGIAPRWYVDVWGDHSREASLLGWLSLPDFDTGTLRTHPSLGRVLATYGVTHMLSPYPQQGASLQLTAHDGAAYIYRVDGAARVRFVPAARHVKTDRDALARLIDASFKPDEEILLHDAPDSVGPTVDAAQSGAPDRAPGRAAIVREDSRHIVIDAEAPREGFLLLADAFFPGWVARVDGRPTPIYRANVSVRAIQLPQGHHEILFEYEAPAFMRGLTITLVAVFTLLSWTAAAAYVDRRERRQSPAGLRLKGGAGK